MSNKHKHTVSGFKVPDGYFDQLTDRVLNSIDKEDAQHAGFDVPEAYFEQLHDQVMERLENSKVVSITPTSSRTKWLYPLLAMAAVFAGVLLFNGFFGTQYELNMTTVEDQDIYTYVEDVAFLQDDEDIELLFADNSFLNDIEMPSQITDDELMDYLLDEVSLNQMITE